jgi:ferredoxin
VSELISETKLRQLAAEWISSGKRTIGPIDVRGRLLYTPLKSVESLQLKGEAVRPANSIKEFLFPKAETLYNYRVHGHKIELIEPKAFSEEQIILGALPCDAAALPILDHVFNWDFVDEFYNRRRAATTVITIACERSDDACFCTSVGLGPGAERGSDVMLLSLGDGRYEVRCLTEKGQKLFAGVTESSTETGHVGDGPQTKFDPAKARAFAEQHFDDAFWAEHGRTCMGCGSCAFSCPTCHCFDIVDAGPIAGSGRVRTWDTCQSASFTQHASGHNPRANQPSRQRQRILHKFSIYPEKFGEILCTGCGNCTRNCPAGLGVLNVLTEI